MCKSPGYISKNAMYLNAGVSALPIHMYLLSIVQFTYCVQILCIPLGQKTLPTTSKHAKDLPFIATTNDLDLVPIIPSNS